MKLLSTAIVILAGAVLMGLAGLSSTVDATMAVGIGLLLIVVGSIGFLAAAYGEGLFGDFRDMLLGMLGMFGGSASAEDADVTVDDSMAVAGSSHRAEHGEVEGETESRSAES